MGVAGFPSYNPRGNPHACRLRLHQMRQRPVDKLYERIFQMMKRRAERAERETHEKVAIPVRV
jgi:hypothetical protein